MSVETKEKNILARMLKSSIHSSPLLSSKSYRGIKGPNA